MQEFRDFFEAADNDTRAINAITDLAKAVAKVFSQYSLATRKRAWRQITSKKGQAEVAKILRTPSRSLSQFRKLLFEE